jgi:hypothetical protein
VAAHSTYTLPQERDRVNSQLEWGIFVFGGSELECHFVEWFQHRVNVVFLQ